MEKKLEGKKCPKFSGDCTGDKYLSNDDFIGKNIGSPFPWNIFI